MYLNYIWNIVELMQLFYNKYSQAAKELAKTMGIGLFTNREFWGAIHYSGNNFVNYEKRDKEEDTN